MSQCKYYVIINDVIIDDVIVNDVIISNVIISNLMITAWTGRGTVGINNHS